VRHHAATTLDATFDDCAFDSRHHVNAGIAKGRERSDEANARCKCTVGIDRAYQCRLVVRAHKAGRSASAGGCVADNTRRRYKVRQEPKSWLNVLARRSGGTFNISVLEAGDGVFEVMPDVLIRLPFGSLRMYG
jgi:hypothetical protein